MSGIVLAYVALLAATAAAASSNGTMSASLPDLLTDPCALGCLTASACPGKDRSCLCDNLDAVTSDASRGCMRDRCPNFKADEVFGQLRGECSGKKKMATDKGGPGKASSEGFSSHAVGSSPAVDSVDTASISSPLPPSPPAPSPSSSATDGAPTTVSASTSIPPPASSPTASTGLPSVISNTYSLSTLPSELSALVVATSAPETSASTASTAGSNIASSSSKDTPDSAAPDEREPSSHDSELSVAAKAGIGISVVVAGLGIIAALLVFGWRRRRSSRDSGLYDDPTSWLRHEGEKHQTLQAMPAFGPTRQFVDGGIGGHDGSGVGGLDMSLDPSSNLTHLSLGTEASHEDDIHAIGVALSSDVYESLDSRPLVAEHHSETQLRDGDSGSLLAA